MSMSKKKIMKAMSGLLVALVMLVSFMPLTAYATSAGDVCPCADCAEAGCPGADCACGAPDCVGTPAQAATEVVEEPVVPPVEETSPPVTETPAPTPPQPSPSTTDAIVEGEADEEDDSMAEEDLLDDVSDSSELTEEEEEETEGEEEEEEEPAELPQEGDVTVTASLSETSYQTYNDIRNGNAPPELILYLDVTVTKEGVAGAYIDVPLTYGAPGDFAPAGDFFTWNEPVDFPPMVSRFERLDVDGMPTLRVFLTDDLPQSRQTIPLSFSFNMGFDGRVPEGTVLWNAEPSAWAEAEGERIFLSRAPAVSLSTNVVSQFNFMNQFFTPDVGEYYGGAVTVRTRHQNKAYYMQLLDEGYPSILYVDLPAGSTNLSNNFTSVFTDKETITGDDGLQYDRYSYVVRDSADSWTTWDYTGIIGFAQTGIDPTFTPPAGLEKGDTFKVRVGAVYKYANGPVQEKKANDLVFTVVDAKTWDFKNGESYHHTGDSYNLPLNSVEENSVSVAPVGRTPQYISAGWYVWTHRSTIKNLGTEDVTGVQMVLSQITETSPKMNFDVVHLYVSRPAGSNAPWTQYRVDYTYSDGTTASFSPPTNVTRDQGGYVDVTPPAPASGAYITTITVTPLGDGGQSGHLLPNNAFSLRYRTKAWPGRVWPNGEPIRESAIAQTRYVLNYNDANGDAKQVRGNVGSVHYVVENTTEVSARVVGQDTTGRVPNDVINMTVNGYNDVIRSNSSWMEPRIAVRIPVQLQFVEGTGTTLTARDGTSVPVTVWRQASDSRYNYYVFQAQDGYAAPMTSGITFTIPFQVRVARDTVPGSYVIDRVLVSSKNATVFNQVRSALNNLPGAESAAQYSFADGDFYTASTEKSTVSITNSNSLTSVTQVETSLTGGYTSAQTVPASHGETVNMKLGVTNRGNTTMNSIRLYNILPRTGDGHGSTGGVSLAGIEGAQGATIYYTESLPPPDINASLQDFNTAGWTRDIPENPTAFYVDFGNRSIAPDGELSVILKFTVPDTGDQTAYNQFAYSAKQANAASNTLNIVNRPAGFSTTSVLVQYDQNLPSLLVQGAEEPTLWPENTSSGRTGTNTSVTLTTEVPQLAGYEFAGWTQASSGKSPITAIGFGQNESNKTVYAQWTPKDVTVVFNANGGAYQGDTHTEAVPFGSAISQNQINNAQPERDGYQLVGWATTPSATTANFEAGAIMNTEGPVPVYALWEVDTSRTFILTFNAAPGAVSSGEAQQQLYVGQKAEAVSAAREGYSLSGWYEDLEDSRTRWDFGVSGMPARNLDLLAKWTPRNVSVTYQLGYSDAPGGGVHANNAALYDGTIAAAPTPPTRTGFDFAGWKIDGSAWAFGSEGTPLTFSNGVREENGLLKLDLVAQWTPKEVTVTFDWGTGGPESGTYETRQATYNTTLGSLPTLTYPPQYSFGGWYAGDSESAWNAEMPLTAENGVQNADDTLTLLLTARWEILPEPVINVNATEVVWNTNPAKMDGLTLADLTEENVLRLAGAEVAGGIPDDDALVITTDFAENLPAELRPGQEFDVTMTATDLAGRDAEPKTIRVRLLDNTNPTITAANSTLYLRQGESLDESAFLTGADITLSDDFASADYLRETLGFSDDDGYEVNWASIGANVGIQRIHLAAVDTVGNDGAHTVSVVVWNEVLRGNEGLRLTVNEAAALRTNGDYVATFLASAQYFQSQTGSNIAARYITADYSGVQARPGTYSVTFTTQPRGRVGGGTVLTVSFEVYQPEQPTSSEPDSSSSSSSTGSSSSSSSSSSSASESVSSSSSSSTQPTPDPTPAPTPEPPPAPSSSSSSTPAPSSSSSRPVPSSSSSSSSGTSASSSSSGSSTPAIPGVVSDPGGPSGGDTPGATSAGGQDTPAPPPPSAGDGQVTVTDENGEETVVPVSDLWGGNVPLAQMLAIRGNWSLFNLIISLFGLALIVMQAVKVLRSKYRAKGPLRLIALVGSVVLGIAIVLIFIFGSDFSGVMVPVDYLTLTLAIILLVQVAAALFSHKKVDEDDGEDDERQSPPAHVKA